MARHPSCYHNGPFSRPSGSSCAVQLIANVLPLTYQVSHDADLEYLDGYAANTTRDSDAIYFNLAMSQPTEDIPVPKESGSSESGSSESGSENLDEPLGGVTEGQDVDMVSPTSESGAAVATQPGRSSKQQRTASRGVGVSRSGRFGGQGIEEQMGGGSAAAGQHVTVVDQGGLCLLPTTYYFLILLRPADWHLSADYWKGAPS